MEKITNGHKIHTIRANYDLWHKRFEKIDKGEACLSLRVWEGKPYRSKQFEFARLTMATNKIGLQKIVIGYSVHPEIDGVKRFNHLYEVGVNDGLMLKDFESWFKNYDKSKPMALIHFTKFRY